MKLLALSALAWLSCANCQLIKISGKWFNKITTLSQDGASSKTMYTPVLEQPQLVVASTLSQGQSSGSAISTPNLSAMSGLGHQNQALLTTSLNNNNNSNNNNSHSKQSKKSVKKPTILINNNNNINYNDKKINNDRIGGVGAVISNGQFENQDDNLELTVAPSSIPFRVQERLSQSLSAMASPDVNANANVNLNVNVNTNSGNLNLNRLSIDRLASQPTFTSTTATSFTSSTPSLRSLDFPQVRLASQPFKDIDSPFLKQSLPSSTKQDQNHNLSTHESNKIQGKQNIIDGKYNGVIGNRNFVDNGNYNRIQGDHNYINGDGSIVIGDNNRIY